MIDRYTIKFGPAVSQKELEKMLEHNDDSSAATERVHKLKVRIELIGDFADIKKLQQVLKELSSK